MGVLASNVVEAVRDFRVLSGKPILASRKFIDGLRLQFGEVEIQAPSLVS